MVGFLKKLFGGSPAKPAPIQTAPKANKKPPLPDEILEDIKARYLAQRKPAVALHPDPEGGIAAAGSRLGGPVWIAAGEAWPLDKDGVPLEFIAQLDFADCAALDGYPRSGLVQFFVGRDDLYGADLNDSRSGSFLVRYRTPEAIGSLHAPPALIEIDGVFCSDFSPFNDDNARENGVALKPEVVEDPLDPSLMEAGTLFDDLWGKYDLEALHSFLDDPAVARPLRHHTGGYPAFTQNDIREQAAYSEYDHVLLRLTSDSILTWGDIGEAVFMIPGADLAAGNFDKTLYSWDCH